MLPDRVSNPGPLTYESGALPIALRGPARCSHTPQPTLTLKVPNKNCSRRHFTSVTFIFQKK